MTPKSKVEVWGIFVDHMMNEALPFRQLNVNWKIWKGDLMADRAMSYSHLSLTFQTYFSLLNGTALFCVYSVDIIECILRMLDISYYNFLQKEFNYSLNHNFLKI